MSSSPRKVVLVSTQEYKPSLHDALLKELLARKIELFCAVGVDADKLEDALDWLCVGDDGTGTHFILTSSHLEESEEEVVEFARSLHTGQPSVVS